MSRRTQRQARPITFDALKARARRAFTAQLQLLAERADSPSECATRFPGLLDFLRWLVSDRPELTALVAAFGQQTATAAEPRQEWSPIDAQRTGERQELLSRVRAQGRQCIAQWDIRCVVSLVRYFPQCIGGRHRAHRAICWIADDPESHWVVSFVPHASGRPGAEDPYSQR